MPYRYREDMAIADVAFEAWGETIEEMFKSAAEATLESMVEDIGSIRRDREITVELRAQDAELLLYLFLEEIVYRKDAERMLFLPEAIVIETEEIDEGKEKWYLEAGGYGDFIDRSRHQLTADIKAVTLHRFKVEETSEGWRTTVVLDT